MFYVYTLTDPRTGAVFYVGKGSGARIQNHEAEARRGVHSAKCDRIRSIWAERLAVERSVVSRHEDENDALDAECALIDSIGLDNLTNVLPGGRLGIEAYLARVADTKRREMRKGLISLAPTFARAMKAKAATGGFGAMVNGRWIEFSDAYEALFRDMIKAVGIGEVRSIMAPYGVNIAVA